MRSDSRLTSLQQRVLATLSAAAWYSEARAAALDAFRLRFIDRLLDAARPTS